MVKRINREWLLLFPLLLWGCLKPLPASDLEAAPEPEIVRPLPMPATIAKVSITKVLVGTAQGTVLSDPPGIDCGSTCTADFKVGSEVTLHGMTTVGAVALTEWSGACTGISATCKLTVTGDAEVTATLRPYNYAFYAGGGQPGTLGDGDGGVGTADAICANQAYLSGLTGHYVPWISTSKINARDRIPSGIRGWVSLYGAPLVDRIDQFEFFDLLEGSAATGSTSLGLAYGPNCEDWTSTSSTAKVWLGRPLSDDSTEYNCANFAGVFCLGIDYATPLIRPSIGAGRIAFVTTETYPVGGGVRAFDLACVAEAQSAGLTGSFKALIGGPGATPPRSRFSLSLPWFQLNGQPMTINAQRLQITATNRVLVNSDEPWPAVPRLLIGNPRVWTGAKSSGDGFRSNCNGWVSTIGEGTVGFADRGGVQQGEWITEQLPCSGVAHLFCFQE